MERLQKVISNAGVTSRRKAEELILAKRVKVNDEIISGLGHKVSDTDKIEVDGILLEKDNKVYYLLNKPRGIVSTTSDDKGRKTVTSLIETNLRIYPVGRLDYDTTGIILLTNDGAFANMLIHPSNEVDKVYVAKIKGILTGEDVFKLKNGIYINGVKTAKAKLKIKKIDRKTNTSIVELTIHEGKNHQVKNMFEQLGYEVIKLKREKIAFLTLDGLKSGQYRLLTPKEVKQLYNMIENH